MILRRGRDLYVIPQSGKFLHKGSDHNQRKEEDYGFTFSSFHRIIKRGDSAIGDVGLR